MYCDSHILYSVRHSIIVEVLEDAFDIAFNMTFSTDLPQQQQQLAKSEVLLWANTLAFSDCWSVLDGEMCPHHGQFINVLSSAASDSDFGSHYFKLL